MLGPLLLIVLVLGLVQASPHGYPTTHCVSATKPVAKTCSNVRPSCSASVRSQCAHGKKIVTVTPCPVTKTKTVTAAHYANSDCVTTTTVYTTQTLTSPTSTETITSTATTDTTTTQSTTEVVTDTSRVDVTATSTTSESGPPAQFKRRDSYGHGSCYMYSTSSACACLGVTGNTVTETLAPSTITRTTTATFKSHSTVTVTKTATSIDRSPATASTTTTDTVTFTSVDTSTTTTVLTSTNTISTTTVTIPYSEATPICNVFQLKAVGSQYDGYYVQYDGTGTQVLAFDQSGGQSAAFTISTSGELFLTGLDDLPVDLGAASFRNGAENVYAATPGNDPRTGNNYTPLVCNANGVYLACYTSTRQPGTFTVYSQGNRLTLSPSGTTPALFTSIRLMIVPICP